MMMMAPTAASAALLTTVVLVCAPWGALGLFACRDRTRCTDISNCTSDDAQYRAGYLCHGFPYFNGWGTRKANPSSVSVSDVAKGITGHRDYFLRNPTAAPLAQKAARSATCHSGWQSHWHWQ